MRAMNIAATGMHAQQLNVEVISHNIANINTTSYKRQRTEFQDLLYENVRRPGAPSTDTGTLVPAGIQIGLGVKTAAVYRIGDQGSLQVTQSPLDLAIEGDGFFQIDLPRYSNEDVMREKLLYAIHSCVSIDNDTRAGGVLFSVDESNEDDNQVRERSITILYPSKDRGLRVRIDGGEREREPRASLIISSYWKCDRGS